MIDSYVSDHIVYVIGHIYYEIWTHILCHIDTCFMSLLTQILCDVGQLFMSHRHPYVICDMSLCDECGFIMC